MTVDTATPIQLPTHTPWGKPEGAETLAHGIGRFSTRAHGGYWLAKYREQARRNRFPDFATFAGGPWYEQDTDWVVVCLTFPDLFDEDQLVSAVRTVQALSRRPIYRLPSAGWRCVLQWYQDGSAEAKEVAARADARIEQCKHLWEKGSTWTASRAEYPAGTWGVSLRRSADGAVKTVYMRYPERRYWTDDQLRMAEVRKFGIVA